MIEFRTEIKIRDLKPSMKDLNGLDDVPLKDGLVVAVKADGESRRRSGRRDCDTAASSSA